MTRQDPTTVPPASPGALRRGSVAFFGTVGSAVGIQAPAAGVSFLPALMAGIVGIAGPFTFGSAVIVMLFVAYAFVVFTREFASAGSVYAFVGRALTPRAGLFAAWLLFLVYVAYAGSVFASNAKALETLLAPGLLGSPAWLMFAAILWAATIVLTRYSIRFSTTLIFVFEGIALLLVVVVAVLSLLHSGSRIHAVAAAPFAPAGIPTGMIGLGIVFAFTGFFGFEVAATLGEETKAPRRIIPAAMVTALILSGAIYTLMSYVETVAYPTPQALATAADHGVPLASIAERFLGPGFGTLITVALIISGFGAQLATVNGATRLLFAASRSGIGPASLSRVDTVHRTPTRALIVVAAATIVPVLALWFRSPLDAFADLATTGADLIIVAYLLTIVAAFIFTMKHGRQPFRLLLLAVGAVVMGVVIFLSVHPLPTGAPLAYLIASAIALLIGGALVVVVKTPALGTELFDVTRDRDSDPGAVEN